MVPRISGIDVLLEILQHDDRARRTPGSLEVQRTDTIVRGRLGEWITLGGNGSGDANSRSALARLQQQQLMQLQQIYFHGQ